jgi:hypothetical protein
MDGVKISISQSKYQITKKTKFRKTRINMVKYSYTVPYSITEREVES